MAKKLSWADRDHGKYTDILKDFIDFLESKIDGVKTGTSGVGEVTLNFDLPKNACVTKSRSFYVRPLSTQLNTPWLVKRVIEREDYFCVCEGFDDVLKSFNRFPLGFSVWTGRKNNFSNEISVSKSTAVTSDGLSRRSAVREKLWLLLNTLSHDEDRLNKINREIFDVLLRKYSEADGAKLGNRFWTQSAVDYYKSKNTLNGLVHEHTVPIKILLNQLLSNKNWSIEDLARFLEKFCFTTVVTEEEVKALNGIDLMSSMPTDWTFEAGDPFARYHVAGLSKVIDRES